MCLICVGDVVLQRLYKSTRKESITNSSRGIIMKKSMITISLIALAVSAFSVGAQAKPNLSITSISEAQANAMQSQGVSSGSSISTTVTIGGRDVRSGHQVTHLSVHNKVRQKWLAKQANVFIKHAVAMYEVRKGDSLYKIAKRYNTTVKRIVHINKLKSTTIQAGQMLEV